MKNNKGFTLVELIAVIGLLLLIATVTVPSIITIQNKNKEKNYNKIQETIITAAESYYHNYVDFDAQSECWIVVQDLVNKNLLKTPILNPKTNEKIEIGSSFIYFNKNINNVSINYTIENNEFPSGQEECNLKSSDTDDFELSDTYVDPSGANEPILAEGMIPIVYSDDGNYIKANVEQVYYYNDEDYGYVKEEDKWYDYGNQKWANAITVSAASREKYQNAKPGTEISSNDINSIWVWIPRFKYKINDDSDQIAVQFISVDDNSGITEEQYRSDLSLSNKMSGYYIHPAFRDINNIEYDSSTTSRGAWNEEISGFWVGKYETGISNDCYKNTVNSSTNINNCKNVTPLIKPHLFAIRFQNTSIQFLTSLKFAGGTMDSEGNVTFAGNATYGLTSDVDTHMMKNTEWGAVAILSQSQYGKMGNDNYTGTNKKIYVNNSSSYYTGRSGGSFDATNTEKGTYYWDDSAVENNKEVVNTGTGASTTGTMYGIYDMSGGAYECTMSNWNENISQSGFSTLPNAKYYDRYTGNSDNEVTLEKIILGDATYETLSWANGTQSFIYSDNPWLIRKDSIFNFGNSNGYNKTYISFRTVLIP